VQQRHAWGKAQNGAQQLAEWARFVVVGDFFMQALGGVREEITVPMHGAPLQRHAIPNGSNRALQSGAATDDEELGPPQAALDEIVEHGAPK
jgi:hypothetical protein